ncbi:MAG: carbamate kinase [Candidatus Melainabacteria bacterium]
MEPVLIAIGGNALNDPALQANVSEARVAEVCRCIVDVLKQGYLPVVTFGNGPQVGNLLDMVETSARFVGYPVPLNACVSWTQGEIGHALSNELHRLCVAEGVYRPIVAVNTTVLIDPEDPAFESPTKPVGQFLSIEDAKRLYIERGWVVGPDANRGYRRLVPSPRPQSILEAEAIRQLIQQGTITLCCGGGGIPVVEKQGRLVDIEAVVDKDYTSCLLAEMLDIPTVIICTGVDRVYLNFGQENQTPLSEITLEEARRHMDADQFAKGSMAPKIHALLRFIEQGGRRAIITNLSNIGAAMSGAAGTAIVA